MLTQRTDAMSDPDRKLTDEPRPAIPYEPGHECEYRDRQRSIRRLAEAGKRKGRPAKRIPHEGKCNEQDVKA